MYKAALLTKGELQKFWKECHPGITGADYAAIIFNLERVVCVYANCLVNTVPQTYKIERLEVDFPIPTLDFLITEFKFQTDEFSGEFCKVLRNFATDLPKLREPKLRFQNGRVKANLNLKRTAKPEAPRPAPAGLPPVPPPAMSYVSGNKLQITQQSKTDLIYGAQWRNGKVFIGDDAFYHLIYWNKSYWSVGGDGLVELSSKPLAPQAFLDLSTKHGKSATSYLQTDKAFQTFGDTNVEYSIGPNTFVKFNDNEIRSASGTTIIPLLDVTTRHIADYAAIVRERHSLRVRVHGLAPFQHPYNNGRWIIGKDFGKNFRKGDLVQEIDRSDDGVEVKNIRTKESRIVSLKTLTPITPRTLPPHVVETLKEASFLMDSYDASYDDLLRLNEALEEPYSTFLSKRVIPLSFAPKFARKSKQGPAKRAKILAIDLTQGMEAGGERSVIKEALANEIQRYFRSEKFDPFKITFESAIAHQINEFGDIDVVRNATEQTLNVMTTTNEFGDIDVVSNATEGVMTMEFKIVTTQSKLFTIPRAFVSRPTETGSETETEDQGDEFELYLYEQKTARMQQEYEEQHAKRMKTLLDNFDKTTDGYATMAAGAAKRTPPPAARRTRQRQPTVDEVPFTPSPTDESQDPRL